MESVLVFSAAMVVCFYVAIPEKDIVVSCVMARKLSYEHVREKIRDYSNRVSNPLSGIRLMAGKPQQMWPQSVSTVDTYIAISFYSSR